MNEHSRKNANYSGIATSAALYAVTIFISSFLLFQIQPIIARYILPWFGGSPAVWTTCMVFFQSLLLLGYTYAHIVGRAKPKTQAIVHFCLLVSSLALLRVEPDSSWRATGHDNPIPQILFLLTMTIGAPYLLVSSTGPLIQHWFAQTNPGQSPYRLFALSNIGSLLGLLTYPFLIEPLLSLHSQAGFWRIGYVTFVILCGSCAFRLFRQPIKAVAPKNAGAPDEPSPKWSTRLLWLALATTPSLMLLATTNYICQEVAVIPFLWILPLSLYLVSFIICFDKESWYNRVVWIPLLAVSIVSVVSLMYFSVEEDAHVVTLISVYSLGLFVCCMVCHGEMVRLKPTPKFLTSFYLLVALGGAMGGVFVSLAAPLIFTGFWELHLGLWLAGALAGISILRNPKLRKRRQWAIGWAVTTLVLAGLLVQHVRLVHESPLEAARNFYGVLRVYEEELKNGTNSLRYMYHGEVLHGTQFTSGNLRRLSTTYYGRASGVGLAIQFHPNARTVSGNPQSLRIGVVGLGTGTIAALTRADDEIRYYEINPEVIRLSEKYFTYLPDSKAATSVVLGDGRIRLEEELAENGSNQFDLLVLDAFSGDAIPVHLVTREAFELYTNHLKHDGILAVHISNKHLDLGPVLKAMASEFDFTPTMVINDESGNGVIDESDWALLTRNQKFLADGRVNIHFEKQYWDDKKNVLWTDDFSNLARLLKND